MSLLVYNNLKTSFLKKVPIKYKEQTIKHIEATKSLLNIQTLSEEQLATIVAFYIIKE